MILMNKESDKTDNSNKYDYVIHPDPLESDRAVDNFINYTEEYKFLESELDKLGLISHDIPLSVSYTISDMLNLSFEKAPSVYSEFISKYILREEK